MLKVYMLEQSEQWDAIVRSFKEYDIYWLSGYVKAFQIHGDGTPILFYYEKNGTRGINVVMKRDISKADCFIGKIEEEKYFDFVTPYGYGGWLIEGEGAEELFKTYIKWVNENDIVSEFIRFHPMVQNHGVCEKLYEVIRLGKVVHMELSSPEAIWNGLIGKNRNMIRKAVKNDVRIYNGRFPNIYEDFRIIYNLTMDKDGAEKYYYFGEGFYKSLLEDLPENAQVFFAQKEEKVIAAAIILTANGRMNYHLSGSLKEYLHLASTNLILYKAALWGNANGYTTFHLGGGLGSTEDGLFKFKRSFYNGDLEHFYIGRVVFDQKKYDELVEMRDPTERDFFPKYRA